MLREKVSWLFLNQAFLHPTTACLILSLFSYIPPLDNSNQAPSFPPPPTAAVRDTKVLISSSPVHPYSPSSTEDDGGGEGGGGGSFLGQKCLK